MIKLTSLLATDKGTGVFSFARYAPAFYDEPQTPESEKLLLERSLKVMVHEIGHVCTIPRIIIIDSLNKNGRCLGLIIVYITSAL